mgnify:CR=1 FL=1
MASRLHRFTLGAVAGLALCLGVSQRVEAQTFHSLSFSLLGGFGGSPDAENSDFGNTTVQASLGVATELGTTVTLRVGRIDIDAEDGFGSLSSATFDYVTLAGDYEFNEDAFRSSLFLGLGAYRVEGIQGGVTADETVPGVTFGVGADFPLTRQISLVFELAGHWANFDDAQLFGTGLGGLSIRF